MIAGFLGSDQCGTAVIWMRHCNHSSERFAYEYRSQHECAKVPEIFSYRGKSDGEGFCKGQLICQRLLHNDS